MKLDDELRRFVKADPRTLDEKAAAAGMHPSRLRKFLNNPDSSLKSESMYNLARAVGRPLAFGEGRKIAVTKAAGTVAPAAAGGVVARTVKGKVGRPSGSKSKAATKSRKTTPATSPESVATGQPAGVP